MYGLVQLASLKHIRARLVAQLNFGAFIEPACCVVRLVACIVFFFWHGRTNATSVYGCMCALLTPHMQKKIERKRPERTENLH
jgi:hypothetical protein